MKIVIILFEYHAFLQILRVFNILKNINHSDQNPK